MKVAIPFGMKELKIVGKNVGNDRIRVVVIPAKKEKNNVLGISTRVKCECISFLCHVQIVIQSQIKHYKTIKLCFDNCTDGWNWFTSAN